MSSEENVIAMPADNSIASDSITAKLIEVSRVAESLDTVLHETQDGLNVFESAMVSTSSTAERKLSSANNSDVRQIDSLAQRFLNNFFLGLEFKSEVVYWRRIVRDCIRIYSVAFILVSYSVWVSRSVSLDLEWICREKFYRFGLIRSWTTFEKSPCWIVFGKCVFWWFRTQLSISSLIQWTNWFWQCTTTSA